MIERFRLYAVKRGMQSLNRMRRVFLAESTEPTKGLTASSSG
jgi:hypothetical protein